MELEVIISIVTAIVTFVCGLIAKKVSWFNSKLIPIQNLLIGVIASVIYYSMTQDLCLTLTTIGLTTGGAYDIVSNLKKLSDK